MEPLTDEKIRVAVRVRKTLERESNRSIVWSWNEEANQIWDKSQDASARKVFGYDRLFGPKHQNVAVYSGLVSPIIESVLQGFNATIFAYGQTASGKTHTMLGADFDPGVTLQAIDHIFDHIESNGVSDNRRFLIRISYIEIYNENVCDLLVNPKQRVKLIVREDGDGQVVIENLQEVPVRSKEEIFELMRKGESNRKYGETNMNERSSRSHTIFRLTIESSTIEVVEDEDEDLSFDSSITEEGRAITVSQLNLVDLAGSERANQTGAVGERLKEGGKINNSLMVLSQVIQKLSDGVADFIPYRSSKLTHILKNSLGGNAKTAMICTVSPVEGVQTKSSLEFASRVKKITQHAQKNEILDERAHLIRMQKEQVSLQKQLQEMLTEKSQLEQFYQDKIKKLQNQFVFIGAEKGSSGTASTKGRSEGLKRRQSWHPSARNHRSDRFSIGFLQKPLPKIKASPCFKAEKISKLDSVKEEEELSPMSGEKVEEVFANDEKSKLDNVSLDALNISSPSVPLVTSRRRRTVRFIDDSNMDVFSPEVEAPKYLDLSKNICTRRKKSSSLLSFTMLDSTFEDVPSPGGKTPKNVLRKRLSMKEEEVQRLSQDYKELQEFTRLERDILDQERESLPSEEIICLKEQIQELREQLVSLEESKKSFEEQLTVKSKEYEALSKTEENWKIEQKRMHTEIADLKEAKLFLEEMLLEKGNKKQGAKNVVSDEFQALRVQNQQLLKTNQDLEQRLNSLIADKSELERKDVKIPEEKSLLKENEELKRRVVEQEELNTNLEDTIRFEREESRRVTQENENTSTIFMKNNVKLHEENKQLKSALDELDNKATYLSEVASELERELQDKVDERNTVKKTMQALEEALSESSSRQSEQKVQIEKLDEQLKEANMIRQNYEKEIQKLRSDLSSHPLTDEHLESVRESLEKEKLTRQQYENEVNELKKHLNSTEEIQEELERVKGLLKQEEAIRKEYEIQIDAFQTRLSSHEMIDKELADLKELLANEKNIREKREEEINRLMAEIEANRALGTKVNTLKEKLEQEETVRKGREEELEAFKELVQREESLRLQSEKEVQSLQLHLESQRKNLDELQNLKTILEEEKDLKQKHEKRNLELQNHQKLIEEKMQSLQQLLDQEQTVRIHLEEENKSLQERVKTDSDVENMMISLEEEKSQMQTKLEVQTEEMHRLQEKIASLEREISTLQVQLDSEQESAANQIKDLQNQLEQTRMNEASNKSNIVDQLNLKIRELETNLKHAEKADSEKLEFIDLIEKKTLNLCDQLRKKKQKIEELFGENKELREKMQHLETTNKEEIELFKDKLSAAQEELIKREDFHKTQSEEDHVKLESQQNMLDELRVLLNSEKELKHSLEMRFQKLLNHQKSAEERLKTLQKELNQEQVVRTQREEEIKCLQERIKTGYEDDNLMKSLEEEKSKLLDKVKVQADELQRLQDKLSSLDRAYSTLQDRFDTEHRSAAREIKDLQAQLEQAKRNEANDMVDELTSKVRELEANLKEVEKADSEKLEFINVIEKKTLNLCDQLRKKKQKIEELNAENKTLSEKIQELGRGTSETTDVHLKEKLSKLQQELVNVRENRDEVLKELEKKAQVANELLKENRLLKQTTEGNDGSESSPSLKPRIDEMKKKMISLENQLSCEKQYSHSLKEKVRKLQKESVDSTILPMSSSSEFKVEKADKGTITDLIAPDVKNQKADLETNKNAPSESLDDVIRKYEDAPWLCGSGFVKDYALDAARAKAHQLSEIVDNQKKEIDFYINKAREWKKKAIQYEQKLNNTRGYGGGCANQAVRSAVPLTSKDLNQASQKPTETSPEKTKALSNRPLVAENIQSHAEAEKENDDSFSFLNLKEILKPNEREEKRRQEFFKDSSSEDETDVREKQVEKNETSKNTEGAASKSLLSRIKTPRKSKSSVKYGTTPSRDKCNQQ